MSSVEYDFSDLDFQPETNELSKNAKGGTELMLERLYNSIDRNLLENFQIIPTRVRELDPNKFKILWIHDLPLDTEVKKLEDPEWRNQFDGIVFVSNWQQQMFNIEYDMRYEESIVIKNAIEPIDVAEKPNPSEQINIIYHTTPHRGLEILVPVFTKLCEKHDNIHLDVYSSFSLYGWSERDKPFEPLFDYCRNHPKITYHGAVSNQEVREALKKSHIFAYPSIWAETSCLAAIEAMSAKNVVVCPNYAGLFETCHDWAISYNFYENVNKHANIFASVLDDVIETLKKEDKKMFLDARLSNQKNYYDNFYNWNYRSHIWENYLKMIMHSKGIDT